MKKDHLKNFFVSFLFFISVIIYSGCGVNDNGGNTDEVVDISKITVENFPRVDGSTSNIPMMTVVACEMFSLEYKWYDAGDGTMQPYPSSTDNSKKNEIDFVRNISFTKTIRAYNRLIYDSTDVILVANTPSTDHLALATSLGVDFTIAPIALDGLVFLLNTANPVNSLTHNQIISIYTGVTTNWKDVGGNDSTLTPYIRNRNSGSQELMEKLVMQGRTMINAEEMILPTMMGLINKIEEDENGIGYTVFYYNNTMVPREKIKTISINGVQPNTSTIASGTYKYTSPVYAIIRTNLDKNSNAYLFWKWLQTKAGQAAIAKSGYVAYSNL
ncbi:MAG: hypothetical protein C4539_18765 [Ignavibacteriales bacterium]|nr:MAG: hypothetical protein C4539_18765 [Ignavibacteriales bacterium]